MATITQKFGQKLRQIRKQKKMTQEHLSEMAKIDYSYLNLIEAGKRNPSLRRITKLARALKISLQELFSFDK